MIERYIVSDIVDSLKMFPSILLNGARQAGKSTLIEWLRDKKIIDNYVTLDDLGTLAEVTKNPDAFISQFKGSLAIDEVQRVPDMLRAVKKSIDEDRRPGRFVLTGSAHILSYPGVTESLAGRANIITLEGLSLGEILRQPKPSTFVEDLFSHQDTDMLLQRWRAQLEKAPAVDRNMLLERMFFGGYPEVALEKNLRHRSKWFSSYHASYIERDVRNLSHLLDVVSFSKLYRILGSQTANLVNHADISHQAQLDSKTVTRYMEMLEITFQIKLLRPWFPNPRKQYVKSPKIYLNDSGQACYLANIADPDYLSKHPALGAIFETWVLAELRKLMALTYGVEVYFYRTYQRDEVDFLLMRGPTACGIECKWSDSLRYSDTESLEKMIEDFGGDARGIILYTGDKIMHFSDKLLGIPIRLLL